MNQSAVKKKSNIAQPPPTQTDNNDDDDDDELTPVVDGSAELSTVYKTDRDILSVSFTADQDYVATGTTGGVVNVINIYGTKSTVALKDDHLDVPVTCIKHKIPEKYPRDIICTYASGLIKSWNLNTNECVYTIKEDRQTLGIAYHHFYNKFITVGDNAKINLYDEETKKQERVYGSSEKKDSMNGHVSRIFCVCINKSLNNEFLTGGWDDSVHYWDLRQPTSIRHFNGVHICGEGIDISKNGKEVLTCAWQRKQPLQLWDYATAKLITNFEVDSHNSKLYCGKWITNELIACGGSDIPIIRIFDQRTKTIYSSVSKLSGGIYSLDHGVIKSKRKRASQKAPAKTKTGYGAQLAVELPLLPRVVFCTGAKLMELNFQ